MLNERDPSAEVLIKISSVLNVDLNWLMRGEGEVFRSSTNKNELSEKEKQLISHYRKMSSDMQVAFDISFRFLSEKQI
ncbi:XRE family transcriptional regulator [Avibacterium volantium]|uniref:XRE family transcriptional regulator n=1 Tax=Avibacterium TaxID=292486 RepID=UPI003BF85A44